MQTSMVLVWAQTPLHTHSNCHKDSWVHSLQHLQDTSCSWDMLHTSSAHQAWHSSQEGMLQEHQRISQQTQYN